MKNNQAGFSLVELMVVVAIIGILATIAVPNFQRFQARAKQASAKTELSGIFTAQKAFFVEYQSYTPDLQLAGFVPDSIALDGSSGIDATEVGNISRIYGSTAGGIGTDGVGGGTVAATGNISEVNGGDALSYTEMGLTASSDYNGEEAYPAKQYRLLISYCYKLKPTRRCWPERICCRFCWLS